MLADLYHLKVCKMEKMCKCKQNETGQYLGRNFFMEFFEQEKNKILRYLNLSRLYTPWISLPWPQIEDYLFILDLFILDLFFSSFFFQMSFDVSCHPAHNKTHLFGSC